MKTTDCLLHSCGQYIARTYLYSAHETTLSYIMRTLGVFHRHIPPYGAYFAIELHRIKETYGYKASSIENIKFYKPINY